MKRKTRLKEHDSMNFNNENIKFYSQSARLKTQIT